MKAILDNIDAGVKAGLEKARKANAVESHVSIGRLWELVHSWEAQAAKVEREWYNDAGALQDCADELRTVIDAWIVQESAEREIL